MSDLALFECTLCGLMCRSKCTECCSYNPYPPKGVNMTKSKMDSMWKIHMLRDPWSLHVDITGDKIEDIIRLVKRLGKNTWFIKASLCKHQWTWTPTLDGHKPHACENWEDVLEAHEKKEVEPPKKKKKTK